MQSLSRPGEGEGVERSSVPLQGTTQQHPSAPSAVCTGLLWELVFWELLATGDPGGARLPCYYALLGVTALTSRLCKHLPKITAQGFLQAPPIAYSPGWPQWYGRAARCQLVCGCREQGSCVQSKVLHASLKHFVLLPSLPPRDLSNPPDPHRPCFCERFRALALLSAFTQLPPNQ